MKLKVSHRRGDKRTKKWFAWFPIDTCLGDRRWLEIVILEQEYIGVTGYSHWANIKVIPFKEYLEG